MRSEVGTEVTRGGEGGEDEDSKERGNKGVLVNCSLDIPKN